MQKGGLILEGGGMRAVYTAGVLDRLLEEGIFFTQNYGVSAGVCHACSYLSRQPGRAAHTVIDYAGNPRYASVRSLLATGDFFGVKMVYRDVPYRLLPFDFDTFAAKEEDLFAVLTNCRTGEAEYLPVRDLRQDMDVIRASSSLPLLSRMVKIEGRRYLDGGVSESIPLARSIAGGNAKNLVILTQHRGYRKEPGGMMGLIRLRYRKYPGLVRAIETRHIRYNNALSLCAAEEKLGRAFIIQPKEPVQLGRLEKDAGKLRALHRQGYADAEASIPALQEFLLG
jgi:predicted patatin/cPLA2 family phospholipase